MSNPRRPLPLRQILNAIQPAHIVTKSRSLSQLEMRLKTFLGEPAATHFSVADRGAHELVLLTDSPVWNSYFRFRVPLILNFLRENCGLRAVQNVRIKVTVAREPEPLGPPRTARLSPQTAAVLRRLAESTTDPSLKSIYQRLSSRADKTPKKT